MFKDLNFVICLKVLKEFLKLGEYAFLLRKILYVLLFLLSNLIGFKIQDSRLKAFGFKKSFWDLES